MRYERKEECGRGGGPVAVAVFIHLLQEFLELGQLVRSKNGAHLRPPLLAHCLDLRFALIMNGFGFGMALQQNGIELLRLLRCQRQLLGELLHAVGTPLRFAERRIGSVHRMMRKQVAQHSSQCRAEEKHRAHPQGRLARCGRFAHRAFSSRTTSSWEADDCEESNSDSTALSLPEIGLSFGNCYNPELSTSKARAEIPVTPAA